MRIPSTRQAKPIQTMRQTGGTQPHGPRGAGGSTGPQGTPGGKRRPGVAGKSVRLNQGIYLWIIVLVEAALTGVLRKVFRRFHGG